MNFFCSVEHVQEWMPHAPRTGRTFTVEEAARAGHRLWRAMADVP